MHPFIRNFTRRNTILIPAANEDPFYDNVILLVQSTSATAFEDLKGHTKTITGTPTIDTGVYKFSPSSMQFDQECVRYPSSGTTADFKLEGSWTIDFWVYLNELTANEYLFVIGASSCSIFNNGFGSAYLSFTKTTTLRMPAASNILTNQWYHVAITYNGTTMKTWLDGIVQSTYTGAISDSSDAFASVGGYYGTPVSFNFNGYLEDFRFTKGVCRYTSDFSVPISLSPTILQFSPDPFANNVVLLMHCDGADGSTTFTDVKGHTVTPTGNAQISTTQSKFGGASALFDGTGDYLTLEDSVTWDFPGDWTVECWFRVAATISSGDLIALTGTNWKLTMLDTGYFGIITPNGGAYTASPLSLNTWYHVAWVMVGGQSKVYLNGTLVITQNYTAAITGTGPVIGTSTSTGRYFNGYLDEIRITKDIARYIINFIPPTLPFPDVPPTSYDPFFDKVVLLLHFDGADGSTTFTDVKGHVITPTGNVQIDTSQSKFGGASALFDGTGDYLSLEDSPDWDFPSTFTVEGWFRSSTAYIPILAVGNSSVFVEIDYDGYLKASVSYDQVTSSTVVNDGSWHHFAVSREPGVFRLYLDGQHCGSLASSSALSASGVFIGTNEFMTAYFNGHLDDIRITQGKGRYGVTFTPPTAAFPDT